MRKMKCTTCGNELDQGVRFCPSCGSAVSEGLDETGKNTVDIVLESAGKASDKGRKGEKEIKRERTKIGFKGTLLIVFISFFLPFCTVSCGSETIISSNGYELAGDLGMTEEQMELYELTPEDTMNKVVVLLIIIMVGSFIATEAKKVIGMTCLAGTASLFMQRIPYDDKWNELRAAGCEVTFEFGYWLAFIMLVLTTLAFLWAPGIIGKVEELYVHDKEDQRKKNQLRETIDGGLSAAILIIIIVAVATNWNSVKSWGAMFHTRKVPDLRDNYVPENSFGEIPFDLYGGETMKGFSTADGSVAIELDEDWATEDLGLDCWLGVQSPDGNEAVIIMQFPKNGSVISVSSMNEMKDLINDSYGFTDCVKAEIPVIPSMTDMEAVTGKANMDDETVEVYVIYGETDYAYYSLMYVAEQIGPNQIQSMNASCSTFVETPPETGNNTFEAETMAFDTNTEISSDINWVGTYIAEDDQAITISSSDDSGVVLTFVGYSEEGWQTRTEVLAYSNSEKTQVSDPYYYEGSLTQETVYTITETGIQVETLPSGGWADGFYLRQ